MQHRADLDRHWRLGRLLRQQRVAAAWEPALHGSVHGFGREVWRDRVLRRRKRLRAIEVRERQLVERLGMAVVRCDSNRCVERVAVAHAH